MIRSFVLYCALGAACCACSRRPEPVAVPAPPPSNLAPQRTAAAPRAPLLAQLAPFRAQIERSEVPYVAIVANKESGTAPWRSKFRGAPYLPKGQRLPNGADGKPLELLAQINFADMPALPDYPATGIVQFFISDQESNQHIYGSTQYLENPFNAGRFFATLADQRYFRVVYHAEVLADAAALEAPSVSTRSDPGMPILEEASLSFKAANEAVSAADYRFERFIGKSARAFFSQFGDKETAVANAYSAYAGTWPLAKVGGYTDLIQQDPREHRPDEDWLVLLQIRSADAPGEIDIMWGDSGVGIFFIRRADLIRRDFSKVAYHWDNH